MSVFAGWGGPILFWVAVAAGGRGIVARLGGGKSRGWGTGSLAGFSSVLILAYLLALARIPIGLPLFLAAGLGVAGGGLAWGRGLPHPRASKESWTPAECVMAGALGVVAVLTVVKGVFFPVLATDAHAYAGRALDLLHDRSLNLALYHWPEPPSAESNLSYPPLMSLAYAVSPAFGGWQANLVTVFLALAWPLALFETMRPRIPRFAALAWTLVLALTPEVFAHVSFPLLNLPAMALAAGEGIALAGFLESGDRRRLLLAGIFAAGLCGIRPDGAAVHGALWLAFAAAAAMPPGARIARADLPALAVALLAPALTLGTWMLYLSGVLGLSPQGPLNAGTPIGLGPVLGALRFFAFLPEGFGIIFFLFALALPWFGTRRRRGPAARFYLAATLTAAFALVLLFSRLDRAYGGGPEAVLPYSFKRALFYLVPFAGLAAALSPWGTALAARGRGWVHRSPLGVRTPGTTLGETS